MIPSTRLYDMLPPEVQAVTPRPKEKKRRSNEESQMQRALIKWWTLNCRHFGVPEILLFSIPNGGARSPVTGAILKAEGSRKGVPDLFLAVPRIGGGFMDATEHGLFLELKRPAGVVSPEQEVFHQRLREQGYCVKVCRSFNECVDVITSYLTK